MQKGLGGLSHCLVMGGLSLFFEPQSPHLHHRECSSFHVAKLCGYERYTLINVAAPPHFSPPHPRAWHVS